MSRRKSIGRKAWSYALLTVSVTGVLAPPRVTRAELVPPAIPELEEGAGIVRNRQLAIALGKALFWDEAAGSDGVACASCHFHAGADSRLQNQLSPGLNDQVFSGGDIEFGSTYSDDPRRPLGRMPSGKVADSNYTLVKKDFPLHQLSNYRDRNSPILSTTNDVVSSAGAYSAQFYDLAVEGSVEDLCGNADSSIFHAGKYAGRQVEPRNTPTTINAGFFYANFWDGRANNLFNGVDVFGLRSLQADPNKRLVVLDEGNAPRLGSLSIRNASLASQAVGPALSEVEMSCAGRQFADLGRKLLNVVALSNQAVSTTDSVLGPYAARPSGKGAWVKGLKAQYTYAKLIQQAFDARYWAAPGRFRIADGELVRDSVAGNTQMELNFSMFWGISIMLYERTLISDQSRFDSWYQSCRPNVTNTSGQVNQAPIGNPTVTCLPDPSNPIASTDPTAHGFTPQEVLGFGLFMNAGTGPRNEGNPACVSCHGPITNFNPNNLPAPGAAFPTPVMSEAAFVAGQVFNPVERSLVLSLGDGLDPLTLPTTDQRAGAVHDRGFFNIGVTPTSDDLGIGGVDLYGNPLSMARMFLAEQGGMGVVDPALVIFPPAGSPLRTITQPINPCAAAPNIPGFTIELGGTPNFPGCTANPPAPSIVPAQERELVDGGFKTPSLRNVALTAPYFHSGNYADLRSVVEFYARGGSQRSKSLENMNFTGDTSGTGPLGKWPVHENETEFGTNVDFFIRDLKSTDAQIDALVAFMLTLTDPRVQCDRAPFDHPELHLRVGHKDSDLYPRDGRADDFVVTLPEIGSDGYAPSSGYCIPNAGDLFAAGMQGRVGGKRFPLK